MMSAYTEMFKRATEHREIVLAMPRSTEERSRCVNEQLKIIQGEISEIIKNSALEIENSRKQIELEILRESNKIAERPIKLGPTPPPPPPTSDVGLSDPMFIEQV